LWNLTSKFTVMRDGVSLKNLGARSENESIFINKHFCIPVVSISLYRNICVCLC
jgi:hypothetical protein